MLVTQTVTDLVVGSPFRFTSRGEAQLRETGGWSAKLLWIEELRTTRSELSGAVVMLS